MNEWSQTSTSLHIHGAVINTAVKTRGNSKFDPGAHSWLEHKTYVQHARTASSNILKPKTSIIIIIIIITIYICGLRRRSAAARLMGLRGRIPPEAGLFVCCECYVLSGRGLCDELITRPEESYRLWCVVVCDLETSWMRRPWPNGGCLTK
jgi:hypothetical protein